MTLDMEMESNGSVEGDQGEMMEVVEVVGILGEGKRKK